MPPRKLAPTARIAAPSLLYLLRLGQWKVPPARSRRPPTTVRLSTTQPVEAKPLQRRTEPRTSDWCSRTVPPAGFSTTARAASNPPPIVVRQNFS